MFADDFTKGPVPHTYQHSALWLASIIIGIAVCLPVFVYGGQIAAQLSFGPMIIALVLGGVITGILMGITTGIGAATRLSATLLAQKIFGTAGGVTVMIAAIVTSLGWWGVQTEIMVSTFVDIAKTTYGVDLNKVLMTALAGSLMITTTLVGASVIGRLSIIAVPLMLIMLLIPFALMPGGVDVQKIVGHTVEQPTSIGLVVGGMVGAWMSGIVILSDFGRFTAGFKTAFTGSMIACLVGMTGLMGLSAILSIALNAPNFMTALPTLGLGMLALVVVVLATWTSNDNKGLYQIT
jgi:cytosine permease